MSLHGETLKPIMAEMPPKTNHFKVHQGKTGHDLVLGEYHAMKTLWDTMPEMVARPYGYGTYERMEDVHFFLCSFHELTDDIPEIDDFPALVAELHKRGVSNEGKFGFPYEVYGKWLV